MSKLMIMAGGTGGHVFPALAVARYLRDQNVKIIWLGTRQGIEASAVPAANFDLEWINIRGVRRSGWLRKLVMPFTLCLAMIQAARVIYRRKPDALLGMGGFVSGPGGLVAAMMRRPLVIHEQNSVAGMTNRYLSPLAASVLTGFPNTFSDNRHAIWAGNPVRKDIAALSAPEQRLNGRVGKLKLLIVGGSQGAKILNDALPAVISRLEPGLCEIWHQCGNGKSAAVAKAYDGEGVTAQTNDFISDMAAAYTWCDVVICRAGAMTVAEVSAAGVAAIFVPYPFAVSDHQTSNAQFLTTHDAAILLPQTSELIENLHSLITDLSQDRNQLLQLAINARKISKLNATEVVAKRCMEIMHA